MLIFHGNRNDCKVALTFDDGPNPYGTPKVLKILDKYNVKATFFLLGKWVRIYPNIVKEINKRGHLIGNHGYSHLRFKKDMKQSANEIFRITENVPICIRPPYGDLLLYLPELLSSKFRVIRWDVSSDDWKSTRITIFNNVINGVKNGSIIVLHDGSNKEGQERRCKEMLKALPKIIEVLKKKYNLVRLDKMKF